MARGGDQYFMYALADRLGLPVRDVESLSVRELQGWRAYLSLEAERADHHHRMQKGGGR